MRTDSTTSAANMSMLLLRPNNGPTSSVKVAPSKPTEQVQAFRSHPVDELTATKQKKAYDAMDSLSKQLIDDSRGQFIDFSA